MLTEEFGLVLDYLPRGKSTDFKEEPLAQLVGTSHFTLLEVVVKESVKPLEKLYIGKDDRDKVELIKRRIQFFDLTSNAQSDLEKAIEQIVKNNPEKYMNFYNKSGPLSIKRHFLEILPGIGKKHVKEILDEREKEEFKDFADIKKRIHHMIDPLKLIEKRIILELDDPELKHYIFTRPPKTQKFQKYR